MFEELWGTLIQEIKTNDFFAGTFVTASAVLLFNLLKPLPWKIIDLISKRLIVKLSIGSYDPVFKLFQQWISEQHFDRYHKSYSLTSLNFKINATDSKKNKARFFYTPHQGSYIFRYNGKIMMLRADKGDVEGNMGGGHFFNETITLMYFGFNTKLFDEIITELTQLFLKKADGKIVLYDKYSYGWESPNLVQNVNSESLVLPHGMFQDIVTDLHRFYDKEHWYISKNIAWHRGYLFQGHPGCGKTKSIMALASTFKKDVYLFDRELMLSGSDQDADFKAAFKDVPEGQFVLFEDIDVFFDERLTQDGLIAFSTFINYLDGFSAKHGVVVFMTTNYPERLDSALIRAGRIDKTFTFGLCDKTQLSGIFLKFIDNPLDAENFANTIPEHTISPAQVQEIMLNADGDAKAALTQAKHFASLSN